MMVMSSHTGTANAAELKVYSTIGVQGAVEQLVPQFEKASGHRLVMTWATARSTKLA
jgi:molybdate transport system substrate-binding protein